MSEKYIFEKDVSKDEQLIAVLRRKINEWGNNIPHHDFYNLGDKVEVLSLWYKPSYPIRFSSQFESRAKGEDFQPYNGDSIPTRKYYSLGDFNSWDINLLPEVKQFTNNEKDYYVQGSQHVTDCHTCKGHGVVTCPKCKGHKKLTCPICRGRGKNNCTSCDGAGKTKCSKCGGHGNLTESCSTWIRGHDGEQKSCPDCGGRGWRTVKCQSCNSGMVTCYECKGRGTFTCSKCNGNGKIICTQCKGNGVIQCQTCQGKKELLHYFYIRRKLGYTNYNNCISHIDVYNQFPEYNQNYQNYEDEDIYVGKQQFIEEEDVPECQSLKKYINESIKRARNDAGQWNYQHFQQLSISCIHTWELKYRFNGKDYVMLFTGSNYEVVPGLSPISEVSFQQWNNIVSYVKNYRLLKAYNTLAKAAEMNVYELKEHISYAREKILKKINDAYFFGSITGMILSMFFIGFIAYAYFSEVNLVMDYAGFINRETNWFYSYHAWTQTILCVLLCYYGHKSTMQTIKSFKSIIPGAILRALTALCLTLLFGLLMFVFWALINATGITIIFTILATAFYWIIYVVIWLVIAILTIIYGMILGIWELIS